MKDDHLKRIVRGVLIYWIIFIIVTYITFWFMGSIPDTLVQVALGGGAFELLCTTIIEVSKKIYDRDKEQINNDIELVDIEDLEEKGEINNG